MILVSSRTLTHLVEHLQTRVSHVIVKGAGDKAFCAGGDIMQLSTSAYELSKDMLFCTLTSFGIVATYEKPFISIMNGITMGGGSSYSVAGKFTVATEKTVYAMPETAIGFFNDSGASYFLPRMPNNVGIYIGLTGVRLKGYDVKKFGLASHFVESRKVDDLEIALIHCKNETEIQKVLADFSSVPSNPKSDLDDLIPRIEKCFAQETMEDIYDRLRQDGSDWARQTIQTLDKMSPTSLKVSLKNLLFGKNLSLRDCLTMDYRIGGHFLIKSDLKEGVRALLIDKDIKPQWNPPTVDEVSYDHVERFFKPLPHGDDIEFGGTLKNKL
jgi:3-hydroxyisobutyryl-CoA hydrolase